MLRCRDVYQNEEKENKEEENGLNDDISKDSGRAVSAFDEGEKDDDVEAKRQQEEEARKKKMETSPKASPGLARKLPAADVDTVAAVSSTPASTVTKPSVLPTNPSVGAILVPLPAAAPTQPLQTVGPKRSSRAARKIPSKRWS